MGRVKYLDLTSTPILSCLPWRGLDSHRLEHQNALRKILPPISPLSQKNQVRFTSIFSVKGVACTAGNASPSLFCTIKWLAPPETLVQAIDNFICTTGNAGPSHQPIYHGSLSWHSENIHLWISLSDDLAFSHQDGIYGFKFPKRFLEVSSRDLTSLFSILII